MRTLKLTGVKPPARVKESTPKFTSAKQVKIAPLVLKPGDGSVKLRVQLKLPENWKISETAPMVYYTGAKARSGVVKRESLGKQSLTRPNAQFDLQLPVSGEGRDTITVSLNYYYCQIDGSGLCKIGSVVFTVPLEVNSQKGQAVGLLPETITP